MKYFFIFIFLLAVGAAGAQSGLRSNKQVSFGNRIPSGNYSGITNIGNGLYALVSDKSDMDGFFIFELDIDSITGHIVSVENKGFVADSIPCRDAEGITWLPETETLLVVGEKDSRILEYDMSGCLTGRIIKLEHGMVNCGYESITYNDSTRMIWTCTENILSKDMPYYDRTGEAIIRLQSYDMSLSPVSQYAYKLDAPHTTNRSPKYYAHGVSELLALDNGALMVLEREFIVPKNIVGASVKCKLYEVMPSAISCFGQGETDCGFPKPMTKTKIHEWDTKLTLWNRSLANYEGMCLGPRLVDGSQVIVLIADSQNRQGGILRDWFRTMIITRRDDTSTD